MRPPHPPHPTHQRQRQRCGGRAWLCVLCALRARARLCVWRRRRGLVCWRVLQTSSTRHVSAACHASIASVHACMQPTHPPPQPRFCPLWQPLRLPTLAGFSFEVTHEVKHVLWMFFCDLAILVYKVTCECSVQMHATRTATLATLLRCDTQPRPLPVFLCRRARGRRVPKLGGRWWRVRPCGRRRASCWQRARALREPTLWRCPLPVN